MLSSMLTAFHQGRVLEIVDFNNQVSNDRSVFHGGDDVSAATGERAFIDTKKIHHRVRAIALCVSVFSKTFRDVELSKIQVSVVSLHSAENTDATKWQARERVKVSQVFSMELPEEKIDGASNFCVLLSLSRVLTSAIAGKADESCWEVEYVASQILASTRHEVICHAQQSLSSALFPWLREEKRRFFESVQEVCAALSSRSLPKLKPHFDKDGIDLETFVDILFSQLVGQYPCLDDQREAATLVALLHELFSQINVNGDERVDWDEFTNHTINSGMRGLARVGVSHFVGMSSDEFDVKYQLDGAYSNQIHQSHKEQQQKPIILMRYVGELDRILVVEGSSQCFKVYDQSGRFLHEHDFYTAEQTAIDRRNVQQEAKANGGDALLVGVDQHEHRKEQRLQAAGREEAYRQTPIAETNTKAARVIHDLIYIPDREIFAVAMSDHSIHFLVEQLSSAGKHRAYKSSGVIVTHSLHRKLIWCTATGKLVAIDTHSKVHSWYLDEALATKNSQKCSSQPFSPHTDIVMDCIFIKDKGLLATCGLDKKIHLWAIENMRPRGVLTGHKLGVRCLVYAQCAVVSGGFDNTVLVWDVGSRECVARLCGHRAAICAIQVAAASIDTATVVTLDDAGECRSWKIAASSSTCVEAFKLPIVDPSIPTRAFVLPWNSYHSVEDFSDIFVGGPQGMYHMHPIKTLREFAPPAAVVFDALNLHFVVAISDNIHVWDSKTGYYGYRHSIPPRHQTHILSKASPKNTSVGDHLFKCEISACCLDQRRLFVGTEHGEILTLNSVTGEIMASCAAHCPDEVSRLTFCQLSKCVVSCGSDHRLLIFKDVKGELDLLRAVASAHESNFVCFNYSSSFSLIVSGDDSEASLAVWDFQTLNRHAILAMPNGTHATDCRIAEPYPVLIAGDATGRVLVWQLELKPDNSLTISPLFSLSMPTTGLRDSNGIVRVQPNADERCTASSTAITALAVCFFTPRSTRSSFDTQARRRSSRDEQARRSVMLFAGTESGHLVSWNLKALFSLYDLRPLQKDQCPPWLPTFKPHRKLIRTASSCSREESATRTPVIGANAFDVPGTTFQAEAQRHAHDESVLHVVVVDDPPCVYTVSADGFQRLWTPNAALSPYGEFALPNLDSRRGGVRTIPACDWTYYHGTQLEVSPQHEEQARQLLAVRRAAQFLVAILRGRLRSNRFCNVVDRVMQIKAFGGLKVTTSAGFEKKNVQAEWEKRRQTMSPRTRASVGTRAQRRRDLQLRKLSFSFRKSTSKKEDAAEVQSKKIRLNALTQLSSEQSKKSVRGSNLENKTRTNAPSPPLDKSDDIPFPSAFSLRSIDRGLKDGAYDGEAVQRLKKIAKYSERRSAYGRRALGTSQSLPELEVLDGRRPAFADSDDANNSQPALVRLKRRGNDIYPLIDMQKTKSDTTSGELLSDTMQQRHRRRRNSGGGQDIDRHVEKMQEAMAASAIDDVADVRRKNINGKARSVVGSRMRGGVSQRDSYASMSFEELARPHYTANDIVEFRNSFNYVDVDLSGTINMEEWFMFMGQMNQRLSETESQLLFIHIDKDGDGSISMRELIAIVFQRCTQEQQKNLCLKLLDQNRSEDVLRKQRKREIGKQIQERDMFRNSRSAFEQHDQQEATTTTTKG